MDIFLPHQARNQIENLKEWGYGNTTTQVLLYAINLLYEMALIVGSVSHLVADIEAEDRKRTSLQLPEQAVSQVETLAQWGDWSKTDVALYALSHLHELANMRRETVVTRPPSLTSYVMMLKPPLHT